MGRLATLSEKEMLIIRLMINNKPPIYGLDLVNKSEGTLKPGTVYVTLARMEDKGYISGVTEEPRPGYKGLPRRLYRLEAKGRQAYDITAPLYEGATNAMA